MNSKNELIEQLMTYVHPSLNLDMNSTDDLFFGNELSAIFRNPELISEIFKVPNTKPNYRRPGSEKNIEFRPYKYSNDYMKKVHVGSCNDYVQIYKDDKLIFDEVFRTCGNSWSGKHMKYIKLQMMKEKFYPANRKLKTKASTQLNGHWCVMDENCKIHYVCIQNFGGDIHQIADFVWKIEDNGEKGIVDITTLKKYADECTQQVHLY